MAEIIQDLGLIPKLAADQRGLFVDLGVCDDDQTRRLNAGGRFAIRADVDALPIQSELQTDYASDTPGVMHACGHDAHAAMAWGTLAILNELSKDHKFASELPAIRVLFQPHEETSRGGQHMIQSGALDGVSAATALHVDPTLPIGVVAVRDGVFTAGCDAFEVQFSGRGSHGSRPHLTCDTVGAVAQWITDIYRHVPKTTNARDAVVINVGQLRSGVAANVVPSSAKLSGTLRTLSARSRQDAIVMMEKISRSIAALHGCRVDLSYGQHTPPVVNDVSVNRYLRWSATELLGQNKVREIEKPSMRAEDFSFVGQNVPAAMFRLGVAGIDVGSSPLHTPTFDIDEDALPIGASVLALAAVHYQKNTTPAGGTDQTMDTNAVSME